MEIKLSAALSRNLESWEMIVVQMYHCGVIIRFKKAFGLEVWRNSLFLAGMWGYVVRQKETADADQQFGLIFVKQFSVRGVVTLNV